MNNKNTNSTHMSREELVKKLKENQNSEGYFTSSSEESAEQPTDNKTLLLYSAIEKFANSLDNKPDGKTLIEMVL